MKTFTAKLFLILGILFQSLQLLGQFADNFSDGDYTNNPVWYPDNESNWTVINNQLRSNSPTANSTFYISTPSAKALNAQWEFFINLKFNTSRVNFVDIYLTSDLADLTSASNNGYFVRVGGTPDEISLYKTTSGTASILIKGKDGVTNSSNNNLRIKVSRNASNVWTLERDATGGTNYVMEGSVTDDSFSTSAFFGIRVTQSTSSFFNKHFFDDFYVGDIILDITPPSISAINILSSTEIEAVFDEEVDENTAQMTLNYSVNNNIGNPLAAVLQEDEKTVRLTFSKDFPNGVQSQLTVVNVQDLAGNTIISTNAEFVYSIPVQVKRKHVIITEIFADPSPRIELPEAEFVELFNRTENSINLFNWTLTDGTSSAKLPDFILLPYQYLIVTAAAHASQFGLYGEVIGVPNFPTLNNAGDNVILKEGNSLTVDSVRYADTWYRDSKKKEGGWSLELIDPDNLCSEQENWIASEDERGGTPGRQNSVFASKPDLTGPKLLSAYPVSSHLVRLQFSEKLEEVVPNKANIMLTPSVAISTIKFSDPSLTQLDIALDEGLQKRKEYFVAVENISDCSGNSIQSNFNNVSFGIPEKPGSLDVLINEILFNPRPTGVDFVEVINTSDKFLNLQNWSIANFPDGEVKNSRLLTSDNFLFKPGAYLVFTKDDNVLKGEYLQGHEENFFEVNLPSFNDDGGSVALVDDEGNIIDNFFYRQEMHSVFIKNKEGVSLERIAFTVPTNEAANWKSASSAAGFATPGYVNSNSRNESVSEEAVTVDPEAFVPITGQPDFTQVKYNFEKGGYLANVKVYDAQGHLIKQLANNALLGAEGYLRWDGDRDDGSKSRVGYYMIWFEVFDEKGLVKTFRKRVAVAGKF